MKFTSPLRYPGGKGSLSDFLANVIDLNDLRNCDYFEPYAGGAGAAINLLRSDVVSKISINDADNRIYYFWKYALSETERFVEKILSIPLTIEEWYKQKDICTNPDNYAQFDVGFSAFYMNRCNRSGVLTGAGPIGGYQQNGKWRLNVRFNREALAERFLILARLKERVLVTNMDAVDFLNRRLPKNINKNPGFVYLDPPYVNKGQRLYLNAYEPKDHAQIASYLRNQRALPWIMSYDDTDLVRNLYAKQQIFMLPIRYSLQKKRTARELIIAPHHISLPRSCRICGQESLISNCIEG
ncbi:DNA adenine methylase [Methylomonas sp. UP202]|uniref:DNA adenine methylase n=1 Tax=Methylomonas sp. UP202 TaxID=3040943 RepID=UPI00247ABDD6|nr:DNA adenine methylase [Methylomonas sp. UP202]WGS86152.1 DNA adenine methylase [Methylomonas sp. UP202]